MKVSEWGSPMISTRLLFASLLVVMAQAASAQGQTSGPTLTVQAGLPHKIAFYPAAKKDCTRTPLPEIKLLEEPKKGKLIVRRVSIKADPESVCPGQTIPGLLVLFLAAQNASGRDSTSYEVKAGERSATVRLNVEVKQGRKSNGMPIDI